MSAESPEVDRAGPSRIGKELFKTLSTIFGPGPPDKRRSKKLLDGKR
jgi:hypothetical protein